MSGDTGYAYIDGSAPFLVNFVQINDFARDADENRVIVGYTLPIW